jgi:hypothetical protein
MNEKSVRKSNFNLIYLFVIVLILIFVFYQVIKPSTRKQEMTEVNLWDGQDISDWILFLADSSARPDTVFYVYDDVIRIGGLPFGYMRTPLKYSGYNLHVEWRWPGLAGNSGVFLNISEPDQQWPATIECQLMSGNAGDFVFLGGSDAAERLDKTKWVVPKFKSSSEKPIGEWNSCDIHSGNDSIIIYINGILQNACSNPEPKSGFIGLQSEGAPIEFKNIYLKYIPVKE